MCDMSTVTHPYCLNLVLNTELKLRLSINSCLSLKQRMLRCVVR